MEAWGSSLQTHRIGKCLRTARKPSRAMRSRHITTVDIVCLLMTQMFPNLRNRSPVRTVTRAFALAISSPDMSSITVGKNHTSKPLCHYLKWLGIVKCNLVVLNCYLLWSPGVWLMDALRPLPQLPAWRTTWLEFTSTRRSAIQYNNPEICHLPFFTFS